MINHPAFRVEPWCLRATELDLEVLAQTESVFALSNGHIGWRGNLDEGEPHGLPGTYLNGVYELRPLPYAEAGYGYPESGQTVINVTNGKLIRLLVDDEPFDVRYGAAARPRAVPGLPGRGAAPQRRLAPRPAARSGSPRPGWCRSRSARSPRSATRWSRSTARSGSSCSPSWSPTSSCHPRRRPAGRRRARAPAGRRGARARGPRAVLVHSTRHSGLRVAAGDGPRRRRARRHCWWQSESSTDLGRVTVTADARARASGCGWSSSSPTAGPATRSLPAVRDQVDGGARRRPADRLGRACSPSSAATSTSSGPAPTSRSTATPRSSRPSASRCSTCCRPAPGPRGGRSPPRA